MREEIFKGATRPAMIFGIPLIPFVVIAGLAVLVSMWGGVLLSKWIAVVCISCAVPLLLWMRHLSTRDDQRLRQLILRVKLSLRSRNQRLWKSRSYAAYKFRGSRDDYAR